MARRKRRDAPFAVEYVAISKDDTLDQRLTVTNRTEQSVLPTLRFTPRNAYGMPLPHVTTVGVNGTHAGRALLAANGSVVDVLRFDGQGADQVRAVDIELTDVEEVDHPALEQPCRTVMIDLDQKATADPTDFWGVGVVNPNPFGVTMRVSLVKLEPEPPRETPRQVADVVTLTDDVDMASQSNHVIWLPDDVRGEFDEVLHHLVPPTLV